MHQGHALTDCATPAPLSGICGMTRPNYSKWPPVENSTQTGFFLDAILEGVEGRFIEIQDGGSIER